MKTSGFKSLGDAGWIGFFSNIFYDRDVKEDAPQGERFTLESHQEYARWANSDPANLPELWFWHLPNVKMGQASAVAVTGPLIVAVGAWDDTEIGARAKAYFSTSEQDWAMSHGFMYQLEDRKGGEYHRYRTHEVTVLPPAWAANPVTLFMEGSMTLNNVKGLKDDIVKAVAGMLGTDEATAEQVAAEGLGQNKALAEAAKGQGAATGQKDGEAAAAPSTEAAPAEAEVGDDTLALALANALIANAELTAQMTETGKAVKSLTDLVGQLQQQVKSLAEADEQRKSLLPKAVIQALAAKASEAGPAVDPATVAKDATKQAEALDAKGAPGTEANALDWFANQAFPPK